MSPVKEAKRKYKLLQFELIEFKKKVFFYQKSLEAKLEQEAEENNTDYSLIKPNTYLLYLGKLLEEFKMCLLK